MDFRASALDIEQLVASFAAAEGTELEQMKDLWRSRNFSFIWEARPKDVTPAFYAQALYSCALSHMVAEEAPFPANLAGLYVLYILYETQDKEDSYKIYLSLEELESLISLVRKFKLKYNLVAFKVVKRMFAEQMFLFGSVSANQKRIASCMARVAHQATVSVQQARTRLLSNIPVREHVEESQADAFDDDLNAISEVMKEAQALDEHKSQLLRTALDSSKKKALSTHTKKAVPVKPRVSSKGGGKTIDDYERELARRFEAGDASEHEKELEEELDRALDMD
ncbi:hypothetical protein R1sor_003791 [Riccia sorocarpa]|uniref:Uncharacterized protein n=1 Tax=Riccia sorocarpa TaxID=122646 RepID=A0ABD3H5G6_9MARC